MSRTVDRDPHEGGGGEVSTRPGDGGDGGGAGGGTETPPPPPQGKLPPLKVTPVPALPGSPPPAGRERPVGHPTTGGGTTGSGRAPGKGDGRAHGDGGGGTTNPPPVEPDGGYIAWYEARQNVPAPGVHRTYTFNALNDWPLPLIGGPAKVGAGVVYGPVPQPDGSDLVAYFVCWGQIFAVNNILVDGKSLSTYNMTQGLDYNVYTGTNVQGVDPLGFAAEPARWAGKTFANIDGIAGKNVAYVVAKFPRPAPGQPVPNLLSFTCEVLGIMLRDPRLGVDVNGIPNQPRVYLPNLPLFLADYMTSTWYGASVPDAQINWASAATAADACDVNIGGGTKRFTFGGMITKRPVEQNIDYIRSGAQLQRPVYNNGQYQFNMDVAQAPSAIVLSDQPGADNILINGCSDLDQDGSAAVWDRVVIGYTDVASGYKDNTVNSPAAVANLNDPNYSEKRFDIPLIPSGDQATRIANYLQKKSVLCDERGTLRVNAIGNRILPGIVITVASYVPWGWVNQLAYVLNIKPVTDDKQLSAWDVLLEKYDATVYDDTIRSVTFNPVPAPPSPYDDPGDVADVAIDIVSVPATLSFSPSPIRSSTLYGAGSISQSGLGSFTASKVNDGDLATACFNINSSGTKKLTFDLGTAKTIREIWLHTSALDAGDGGATLLFSDDGVTFTPAFGSITTTAVSGGITRRVFVVSALSVGAHRYLQLDFGSVAVATTYTEVAPKQYVGTSPFVETYSVYSGSAATRKLFKPIGARNIPTPTAPLNIEALVKRTANYDGSGSIVLVGGLFITATSSGGTVSAGYSTGFLAVASSPVSTTGIPDQYVRQDSAALALSNGLNSNINYPNGPGLCRLSGPSAAFSIGGFAGPTGGVFLRLSYTGTQQCTIVNADASSSAANRIRTFTGNNIVTRGAFEALLDYNPSDALWELTSFWDGTLQFNAGYLGVGGYPTGAPTVPKYRAHIAGDGNLDVRHLLLGYDSTADYGVIQSADMSLGFRDTMLSPDGGSFARVGNVPASSDSSSIVPSTSWVHGLVKTGSAAWNPGTIAAGSSASQTFTVTGAAVGDPVSYGVTGADLGNHNVSIIVEVSAANTAKVTIFNHNSVSEVFSSQTWKFAVSKF